MGRFCTAEEISAPFQVADLFNLPQKWPRSFDLVFECNTIQVLSAPWRVTALNSIAELIAPGGRIRINCLSHNSGKRLEEFSRPRDQQEIAGFERAGLKKLSFSSCIDDQTPPFLHFFAC